MGVDAVVGTPYRADAARSTASFTRAVTPRWRGLTDGLRCAEPAPAPAFADADADAATDELDVFVTGTPSARIAATGVVVAERGNTYKH